ncbi:uncharacterized protein KRP23_6026 [Phytophthora ramorum]|uniref:uncharacterized protein n=1 Tax=Phytophthora ramorum TaxID=164328 RepID=UPI0030A8C6C9|nr:hypothetical protein KRP23_6026 [Phytophthora ramorum]
MGKASVLQVQQDVPGNASREVFQGLFKDLGKQAMALEAILRAVCGRVDKMETWLTEVSFGMTELDLKLRNIAHNIDGTAAVDDEAQGPHRWVTPPDETKPLAATVSKKLGTDKKAVRVTGMAAAILDRLATTSSVTTPTVADVEKVEKTTAKKKSKDKKHNTKKTKSNGSAEVAATPVAESVQTTETKPVPSTQHSPASIGEEVPATIHLQEPAASEEESVAEAPAEFDPPATLNEPEARDLVAPVLSQDYQAVVGIVAPSFESYVVNGQSGSSSNATDQADIDEKSGESDSEASADGSGSSSSDEDDEDDAEAGAAVEEISKTMIALKKLKRAHMLSPEEETELKERAHKKWFQLKGHIKEKQKKDVTNILLKRKKNVFTVSSRIELLEEKSREIFAALKQMTNEMREKNDRTTHETLRRRVTDIEQSLLSVDSRFASLSAPATEKVCDLESEVVSLRNTVQIQLATAQSEATARHSLLEEALASQRAVVDAFAQDVPTQLSAQAELFFEKLKQQPDYTVAIENLKRGLRRKADLKVLKELEARLLGLDAENEDCLVRCLSCRKEVVNPYNEKDTEAGDQESMNTGSGPSQLRKVNPGPSSARIYRSNVPFSAQPLVQESISEESPDEPMLPPPQILTQPQPAVGAIAGPELHQQFQSAGDSYASEKPPAVRVPSAKWSAPPTDTSLKRDVKSAKASPLSLMNITATRAILSPDRPISAPAVPMKKKNPAVRSKSLLKSLTPQPEPPL